MEATMLSPEARTRGKTKSKKVHVPSAMAGKAKKIFDADPLFVSASTPSTPSFEHELQSSSSGNGSGSGGTNRQKQPKHRLNYVVDAVEEVPLTSPVVATKKSNRLETQVHGRLQHHHHPGIETNPPTIRTGSTGKKSPVPKTRSFNSLSSGEITVPRSNKHKNKTQFQAQMESVLDDLRRIYVAERFHHHDPYNTFSRHSFADVPITKVLEEKNGGLRKAMSAIQSPLTPHRRDVSSQKHGIRGTDMETEASPRGVTEPLSPSRRARYLNERKLQRTTSNPHKQGIEKSTSGPITIQANRRHQSPSTSRSPSGTRRHQSPPSSTTSTTTPSPHRYPSSPFLQSPVKVRRSSVSPSPRRRPRSHSPHSNTYSTGSASSTHLSKQIETRSLRGDRTTGTDRMMKNDHSSANRHYDRSTAPTKSRGSTSPPIQKSKTRSKKKSSFNDREGRHKHHQHRHHSHHSRRHHDRSISPASSYASSPSIKVRRRSKTPPSDASRSSTSHFHDHHLHHEKRSRYHKPRSRLSHGGNSGGHGVMENVPDLQSPTTPTRRGRRPCRSKSPSAAGTAATAVATDVATDVNCRVQPHNSDNKTLPLNRQRGNHSSEKRRHDTPGSPRKKKATQKTNLKSSTVTKCSRSLSPRRSHHPTASTTPTKTFSPGASGQNVASPVALRQPQFSSWRVASVTTTMMDDENRATHHRPQRDFAGSIDWRSLSPRIHEGKRSSVSRKNQQQQHHARSPVPSTSSVSLENRPRFSRGSGDRERLVKANDHSFDKNLTLALVRKWNEIQIATAVVESIQARERRFHESHGSGSISSPSARSNRSSKTSGSYHCSGGSRSNRGGGHSGPNVSNENAIEQQQQRLWASLGDGDANDEYMSQAKHRNEARRHSFTSLQDHRSGGGGGETAIGGASDDDDQLATHNPSSSLRG